MAPSDITQQFTSVCQKTKIITKFQSRCQPAIFIKIQKLLGILSAERQSAQKNFLKGRLLPDQRINLSFAAAFHWPSVLPCLIKGTLLFWFM